MKVFTSVGTFPALTYIARPEYVDDSLRPYSWYRDLAVAGARQAVLPSDYVSSLAQVAASDDPDRQRDSAERAFLPSKAEIEGGGEERVAEGPYDREGNRIDALQSKIDWLRLVAIIGGAGTAIWVVAAAISTGGFWRVFLTILVVLVAFKLGFAPLFAVSSLGLSFLFHRLSPGFALGACILAGALLYAGLRAAPKGRAQTAARWP